LLTLNKAGYDELLKITADLNSGIMIFDFDTFLKEYDFSDMVCIIGYEDSCLYNKCVSDYKLEENEDNTCC
jgi:hypothetical protein